jgi:hypothetical protein
MEAAESMTVGECGNEQIDGREPVMADASDLRFGVERSPFDSLIEPEVGERQQLSKELLVPDAPRVFSAR